MTIKQKQCLLAYLGYYKGGIDGIWGARSESATFNFKRENELPDNGVFDAETEKKILSVIASRATEEESDAATSEPSSGTFWDDIEYFERSEFACKCGQYHAPYCNGFPAEPKEQLARIADKIRKHFGKPAIVVSGLRCRQHNADCDGVVNSQHMYGEACDISVQGVSGAEVLAYVQTLAGIRYAYKIEGSENVHFDIPKGDR